MAVLRDIVARLGIQLDTKSFAKSEAAIGGLSSQLSALSQIVIGVGAVVGITKLVNMASDAGETLNLLNETFKGSSQQVQDWGATFAVEAGRSEFALLEMAGTLGAVLNPLMEGNAEVAAKMATQMAALTVDMGSFFNTTDTDALAALKAGIVGEMEPLKRFGVVMLQTRLQAFALSKGIRKTLKAMTEAERTTLRTEFITRELAIAMGDAARTSEGWANATKAVGGVFKDLATQMGLKLIPAAEKIVIAVRDGMRVFLAWSKSSEILTSILLVLGAVGVKVAVSLMFAWRATLLPVLKFAIILAVAALVLDDFLVFMKGGDSIIGRFIDKIFGPGSATAAVEAMTKTWEDLVTFWQDTATPALQQLGRDLSELSTDLDAMRDAARDAAVAGLLDMLKKLDDSVQGDLFAKSWTDAFNTFKSLIDENVVDLLLLESFYDTTLESIRAGFAQMVDDFPLAAVLAELQSLGEETGVAFDSAGKFIEDTFLAALIKVSDWFDDHSFEISNLGKSIGVGLQNVAGFLGIDLGLETGTRTRRAGTTRTEQATRQSLPRLPTPEVLMSGGGGGAVINQSTTENVSGNATAQDAGRIATAAEAATNTSLRQSRAALTQEAS